MIRRLQALAAALLALAPAPAAAWWDFGHRTTASIAWSRLSPAARHEVRRLVAHAPELATPTCPIRSIEDASVWPDCIKTLGERFSHAFPWHFQNVDICKPFDIDANCPFGACVSRQITRQAALLADRTLPDRERLQALAFLVHLVGDLHQPLHAGDHNDLGGNRVPARYGPGGPRGNLHLIWDGWLAERAITTPPADLLAELGDPVTAAAGTVEDWSREVWEISRDRAYAPLLGDPCAAPGPEPVTVSAGMIEAAIPVVRQQIARGGLRLARLIEEALAASRSRAGARERGARAIRR